MFACPRLRGRAGPLLDLSLRVHIVMDNYGTHKTKAIRDWFAKRPRWQAHFTPTSASWLNQVERWFGGPPCGLERFRMNWNRSRLGNRRNEQREGRHG